MTWIVGLAGPVIAALVAMIGWLLITRKVGMRDRKMEELEGDVTVLRDRSVVELEKDVKKAEKSRGKIYGEMTDIRTHFMHKKECKEFREGMMDQIAHFNGSVLKLERVGERTDMAMKRQELLMEQLIAVKEDVAGVVARVESLNGKRK